MCMTTVINGRISVAGFVTSLEVVFLIVSKPESLSLKLLVRPLTVWQLIEARPARRAAAVRRRCDQPVSLPLPDLFLSYLLPTRR